MLLSLLTSCTVFTVVILEQKQLQISCAIKICLFACHGKLMGFSNMRVKEILEQILNDHARKTAKVLLVTASDHEAQHLSSSLKLQNCTVTNDSHGNSFTICSRYGKYLQYVVYCRTSYLWGQTKSCAMHLTFPKLFQAENWSLRLGVYLKGNCSHTIIF